MEGLAHEAAQIIVVKHNRTGKIPRSAVNARVKFSIVSEVVNHAIILFAAAFERAQWMRRKQILQLFTRTLAVVIKIDLECIPKCLDQPIAVVRDPAPLRRKR